MRSLASGAPVTKMMHLLKNFFNLDINNKKNLECVCISRVVIVGMVKIAHMLTQLRKMDKHSLMTQEMITNARSAWRWSWQLANSLVSLMAVHIASASSVFVLGEQHMTNAQQSIISEHVQFAVRQAISSFLHSSTSTTGTKSKILLQSIRQH